MTYHQYTITSEVDHDILIAFMAQEGFDSFADGEGATFFAYRSSKEHQQAEQFLQELAYVLS